MTEAIRPNPKFLDSKEKIKVYLGNISDRRFRDLVRLGMPARYEQGNGWFAHADNIEAWYRAWTGVSFGHLVDEIEKTVQ
jgi:hypothetical protein